MPNKSSSGCQAFGRQSGNVADDRHLVALRPKHSDRAPAPAARGATLFVMLKSHFGAERGLNGAQTKPVDSRKFDTVACLTSCGVLRNESAASEEAVRMEPSIMYSRVTYSRVRHSCDTHSCDTHSRARNLVKDREHAVRNSARPVSRPQGAVRPYIRGGAWGG
jgi:hypothetical protein